MSSNSLAANHSLSPAQSVRFAFCIAYRFFIWFLLLLLLLGLLHPLVLFNTDLFGGYTKLLAFCTEVSETNDWILVHKTGLYANEIYQNAKIKSIIVSITCCKRLF